MAQLNPDDPLGENFVKGLCIGWRCNTCQRFDTPYCRLQCEHRQELEHRQEYNAKTDFHIRAANALHHTKDLNLYFERVDRPNIRT